LAVLAAMGSGLVLSTTTALAQEQQLQRVEITGSSIKRIEGESALPVQVITRDQIAKTGAQNVEQLLQSISAVTSSGGISASSASGATTGGISSVSIHALTSIRTLVLLNGRRIAPYGIGFTGDQSSVDVNSIPLAAVERVEVLKDGASAIYGSDAIAGVVNFITTKDLKGGDITAEYGDTTRGGADFKKVTGRYGFGDFDKDRFNVLLVGSIQKEGSLVGGQRDFARSAINTEAGNDTTSGNTFPGNIAAADGTSFAGSANPTNPTCPGPYAVKSPLTGGANSCRFDTGPFVTLIPETERYSFFGSGRLAITNDIEAYAEAGYNRNKIRTIIQPVPLSDQFALPPNHPLFNVAPYNGAATFLLQPSSPFYPTAYVQGLTGGSTPDLLVRYRDAANGNRDITDISEATRFVLGTKGSVSGWDFDANFLYSESKMREQVNSGYPAYSQILPLLNSGLVNPFGPNSPDIESQIKATEFHGDAFNIKSSITGVQAKVSKELFQLPAGPLAMAVGAEAREERYLFDPNATIQTGDISGYGGNFLTTDKKRTVNAVFAEMSIPVVKGLELNPAVRFDHYEGTGNSTTPKLGLRYQPTKEVLLRGSIGRGFRAPSLQEQFLPQTTGVSVNGLNDPLRCGVNGNPQSIKDCNTQFAVLNGGNPSLQPEKSQNLTFGLVLEPIDSLSVALDYFKVKLTNSISASIDPAIILADPSSAAKYGYLVTRAAPTAQDQALGLPGVITSINQTNINIGGTKVSGIDIDLKYRFPSSDLGKFSATLDGTYFIDFDTQNPDGSWTGGVDTINTLTGGVVARWKHYAELDWSLGPWSAALGWNYQKGYHDIPSNVTGAERDVAQYSTWDLQGTYTGFKNLKLTLGVKNVLNTDPPYTNMAGVVVFQSGYDPEYADPRGRFIYARATYSF